MSYVTQYTANFTNEQSQAVNISILKNNGDVIDITNYEVTLFEITDNSEEQTKYGSTLISRTLRLGLWVTANDSLTGETFLSSTHDEWMIVCDIDGQKYFEGLITPEEGDYPFQDKPYEIIITATNGVALLKETALVDVNGLDFDGDNLLIDYIAGALKQTGLSLPIRIYCGYFYIIMQGKGDALTRDMFNQTYLNYRTFQKSPTEFVSCYDALKIILDKFCRLEYWNGMWVIKCIAELQYLPSKNYYADYFSDGTINTGSEDTTNYAQVGKDVDLYPINETQQVSSRFALKSAKTSYQYIPWPELPKNYKFDRGSIVAPISGNVFAKNEQGNDTADQIGTYQGYTIDDWTGGFFNPGSPAAINNLPSLAALVGTTYQLRTTAESREIEREIEIHNTSATSGSEAWLQSEGIPIKKGDRIKIDFEYRLSVNFDLSSGGVTLHAATAYIIDTNGDLWLWLNRNTGLSAATNQWIKHTSTFYRLDITFQQNSYTKVYQAFSAESDTIPVDGTLYVAFASDFDSTVKAYFRKFNLEYRPFIAGGYLPVKGDYRFRSQNASIPDIAEDEVKISDSERRVMKGAMIFNNGVVDILTTKEWYRYGDTVTPNPLSESRGFKELLNIGRYNHSYRRMMAISGTFNGLNDSPQNDQFNKTPVSFFKRYRFVDMNNPRDFVLVPPLKMDIVRGWSIMNFVEAINPANGNDGTQTGDNESFNYVF